jgi:rSAM/selenodomain-associated transferase 1
MKRAIIIMAKVPSSGNVKTRLQPFLSLEECAALSEAFLQDAVSKAKTVCENVILAYSPNEKINDLKKVLPFQNVFVEQTGMDLGEKMFNAFKFVFETENADSVVMTGTDSPTFPFDFIEQAFEFLETNSDMVLGKTEDGGFYLIGLRKLEKEIFENVRWSSPDTFEQIFENIHRLNLHLREVPSWYDVDEPEDYKKLREEILHNTNAQRRAPKTFELINRWGKF